MDAIMRCWFKFRHDLGWQLFALYLLLIVPFLITLAVFNWVVGERIRRDAQSNDLALARAIALETDISIGNALTTVVELSTYPSVMAMDEEGMKQVFQVVLNARPDVNLVYRLDADGIMAYHYPVGPLSTVGNDFSFREYFLDSKTSNKPLISEGRISPTTNQAVATAVMPIRSTDGEFLGLVGTNIRLESLSETLSAILLEYAQADGFEILILDAAGQVIAHPDATLLLIPASEILPDVYRDVLAGESGSIVSPSLDEEERLYTYASISTVGWGVVISRPASGAFSTQITLSRIVFVTAGTFLLIGLFFWRTLTVRVIQPIERLVPISETIGLNQPIGAIDQLYLQGQSYRSDQVGQLIVGILRMKDSISERIKEQATLLETSTAVVSSLDSATVLDQILEQMGRLLHIQMYAIIALDPDHEAFKITASRGLSHQFTEQLSIQPTEPDSVTMRALHSKEPIQVSDTETDPSYVIRRQRARVEGFRAILAVPLNTQHAPPTALLVFHPSPHVFTSNEIQLLTSFANHAAMAVENAVLYEQSDILLREQTQRLQALIQSMHDGLVLSDLKGMVVYANNRVGELSGLAAANLSGQHVDMILANIIDRSAGKPPNMNTARKLLNHTGGKNMVITQSQLEHVVHLRLEVFNVNDEVGSPIGRGIIFHDITADRELDRMRSSLVSTVSHELRTPLAAIKGYVSTMLAEDVEWDRSARREFLTIISDESDRLTNLINNLLDLSRIEAGSLKLSYEKCDVREVVRKASKATQLTSKNQLEIRVEAKLPALYADPLRLESILRNLIENSIKYAGGSAKIKIEVERKDKDFRFCVSDDGPGIPPEESERIFDRFYRRDDSLTRQTTGAGLGLAICQGLVRAHGGRIWSEPGRQGACIVFTMPVRTRLSPGRSGKSKRKVA